MSSIQEDQDQLSEIDKQTEGSADIELEQVAELSSQDDDAEQEITKSKFIHPEIVIDGSDSMSDLSQISAPAGIEPLPTIEMLHF